MRQEGGTNALASLPLDEQVAHIDLLVPITFQSVPQQTGLMEILPLQPQVTASRGAAVVQTSAAGLLIPCCLELFAGSGKLTATFIKKGIKCTAVDNLRNKARSLVPCLRLDLTLPGDQNLIITMLYSGTVRFVWLAPPCGTASRARERPLPAGTSQHIINRSKPLRSNDEPMGLSTLTALDLQRVESANKLYLFQHWS